MHAHTRIQTEQLYLVANLHFSSSFHPGGSKPRDRCQEETQKAQEQNRSQEEEN